MGRKVEQSAEGFLVRETVSAEERQVTPAFPTEDELIAYLAKHGDFWDQAGGKGPWDRVSATLFVRELKELPTMMMIGGQLVRAREIPLALIAQEGGG
jgi:hypothetical protein